MNSRFPSLRRVVAAIALAAFSTVGAMAQSGALQFSSMAYSVKESIPMAKITVSRTGGSAGEVSVNFATSDGTAIAGEDYVATNGVLTFGPGVTSRVIYVPILDDGKQEANETVTVDLIPSGINNATLTIIDNDPCTFTIAPVQRLHGPEAGNGSIAVTATEGCDWLATETADWLSVFLSGNGEIQYSLDANFGAASRTAAIQIADKVFTVTQQGVFVPTAGSYNGLFYEDLVFRHESSGLLTVKVTDLGRFTAKIVVGGKRFAFSGALAADGNATNAIVRPGASTLSVVLSLHLTDDSDQITGYVTDGIWTASLIADRALFHKTTHPAPQAGRYTLIVRGDDEEAAEEPGGDSFGTVVVDAGGSAKLSLTLADGTKATQKIPLSKNGEWPLYVPLYRGGGSILSRVVFSDIEDESDFAGTLAWIKPASTTAKFYRAGIAEQVPLAGSLYRPPTNRTDRLLSFSSGAFAFTAGNLAAAFTNAVTYSDDNKVLNLASNKMKLTVSLPTGLFSGSVIAPGAARSTPFKGALFQKADFGAGFFLGTDQSGRVLLSE